MPTTEDLDPLLLRVASLHTSVDDLLTTLFGFLHRKTDLYVVATDPEAEGAGFLPGEAEKRVVAAFRRFPYKKAEELRGKETRRAGEKDKPSTAASGASSSSSSKSTTTSADGKSSSKQPEGKVLDTSKKQAEVKPADVPPPSKGDPSPKRKPRGNGGVGPNYQWTQTLKDVSVWIPVPPGTRAKDVKADWSKSGVRVRLKDADVLAGEFPPGEGVKPDECVWSLESDTISIELSKSRETWWPCVLSGHPEIDTQLVDSSQRVADFDPATQTAIRKAMAEQQEKHKMAFE